MITNDDKQKKDVLYYEAIAEDCFGDKEVWFRYLGKIINRNGCLLQNNILSDLLSSDKLSMFQKVTLKQASIPGTPTNIAVSSLEEKAKTPMIDEIRRRIENDKGRWNFI